MRTLESSFTRRVGSFLRGGKNWRPTQFATPTQIYFLRSQCQLYCPLRFSNHTLIKKFPPFPLHGITKCLRLQFRRIFIMI